MYPDRSPRKWISAGLAVMFVLIGVATILSILLFRGTYPSMMGFRFGWFPIIGLFFLFIILKWIFFPWGWGYRRYYWRDEDRALQTIRERYAKGEITKEQYEQILKDLVRQS